MKPEDLLNAMTDVNENYIEEAAPADSVEKKKEKVRTVPRIWMKVGVGAACVLLCVALARPILYAIDRATNNIKDCDYGESPFYFFGFNREFDGHDVFDDLSAGSADTGPGRGVLYQTFDELFDAVFGSSEAHASLNRELESFVSAGEPNSVGLLNTVHAIQNGEACLLEPRVNGAVSLNGLMDWPIFVNTFSNPKWGYAPGLVFLCAYDEAAFDVRMTYPSTLFACGNNGFEYSLAQLGIIKPDSADKYKRKSVRLYDGTDVEAIFLSEKRVIFYYRNVLVDISASFAVTDDFLSRFGLVGQ